MRKTNSEFLTAFLSEAGTELNNGDYFGFVELPEFACYVIADGLHSELSSARAAIQCIIQCFQARPSIKKGALRRYLHETNEILLRRKKRVRASVTVVVTDYQSIRYAYAGNTRMYLYRGDSAVFQSRDMSLGQELARTEVISQDKLARHAERNNLYSYLGQRRGFSPQISEKIKLRDADVIALFTRGIWENLDDGELADVFAEASDSPADTVDLVEEMLLSKQTRELQSYTIAAIFVNKVFVDPKKPKKIKKIIIISAIVLLIAIVLTIILYFYFKGRREKREGMEDNWASAIAYIEDDNYVKARDSVDEAETHADELNDKDMLRETGAYLRLLDAILNADALLSDGKYEEAQDAYRTALELSIYADNRGKEYIETAMRKTELYTRFYDYMDEGDVLLDLEDADGAIAAYNQARETASELYFAEGKSLAADAIAGAKEKKAEEEAAGDEKAAAESEQAAAATDDLAEGDKAFVAGDYDAAKTYYMSARRKYQELEDESGVKIVDAKIALADRKIRERESKVELAKSYSLAGDKAMENGEFFESKQFYILAKQLYAELEMANFVAVMDMKLELLDAAEKENSPSPTPSPDTPSSPQPTETQPAENVTRHGKSDRR